ncbi:MAG: hypothetical protein WC679_01450 [Bacteroidales bacterium]|jgi:NTP pyrophosphatase (non-canonical NTP hydrolase)
MTKLQFLLAKLAEECCEVAQATLKAKDFGMDGIIPDTSLTNRDRINAEINDVIAIIEMLNATGELQYSYDPVAVEQKKKKVERYALQSEALGFVNWTQS